MGKASKKKSQRRMGNGPSRADIERGRAQGRVAGALRQGAGRAVIGDDRIAPVLDFLTPRLDAALAPVGRPAGLTGEAAGRALVCAVAHDYLFADPEDTDLLNRLDEDSSTGGSALETLVREKLLTAQNAIPAALAMLALLAGLCRTTANSVLEPR